MRDPITRCPTRRRRRWYFPLPTVNAVIVSTRLLRSTSHTLTSLGVTKCTPGSLTCPVPPRREGPAQWIARPGFGIIDPSLMDPSINQSIHLEEGTSGAAGSTRAVTKRENFVGVQPRRATLMFNRVMDRRWDNEGADFDSIDGWLTNGGKRG